MHEFSVTTAGQVIAIGLTLGVHILGGLALIYMLVRDSGGSPRDWWPGGDDGGPPRDDPRGPQPHGGDSGGLPLPGAQPSPVRLRDGGQIADAYPRPQRRPVHPERAPQRTPRQVP